MCPVRFAVLLLPLTLTLPGYQEVATRKGVTVLAREGTAVIDLIAVGDFAAPVDRVFAALIDYEKHPQFLKNVAESRVVARGSAEMWVYQRLALPVIADRDVTIHVAWGQDGQARWLTFNADNPRGPGPRDGVVRIPLDAGGWRLEPIDGGRSTRARHWLRLDLAGSLPRFLGRSHAGTDIPDLFESFRKRIGA
jgi:uncharacterized protein YndB with AHSA1/START domain